MPGLETKISLSDQKEINKKIDSIRERENDSPSVIIVHNLQTHCVEYMSARGRKILNVSMEELHELGENYFYTFFNPDDAKNYTPKFIETMAQNDLDKIVTFFQQVRPIGENEWSWYLSSSKLVLQDEKGNPLLAVTNAHPIDELSNLTVKLERILRDHDQMKRDLKKFELLTKRERQIVGCVVKGYSNSEIAERLFIAIGTVEQHRKNIKRKLEVKTIAELIRFAEVFDMNSGENEQTLSLSEQDKV